MPQHALNPAFVRAVTPGHRPRRYRDGNGLYLLVAPGARGGGKSWVQRLTVHGRAREFGLGSFKDVSLKEARAIALENRRIARSGGDPGAAGRRTGGAPVFADALETVIAIRQPGWKGGPHVAGLWRASLRRHAFPRIGRKRVDAITTADVMAVLAPIWTTTPGMARKVRQRIGAVMKWAVAEGYRDDNPAGDAVVAALPGVKVRPTHRRALPYAEVAAAVAAVRGCARASAARLSFEFAVLCAARPGEARRARWEDIDLDTATWTIPASAMKSNRTHRVPLSDRAVAVLGEAGAGCTGWVFPSPVTGGPFADNWLRELLTALGIAANPHGFRSSFRDWAAENTDAPRAVMEAALAHVIPDATEAAYARSDLFEHRRTLMQQWADYLAGSAPAGAGSAP